MINYTVVIPHKNTPDLLRRCLNSIPKRDDIQIVVVDDNSDPTKVDFEHFPGLGEECVEVYFTKEGKGAGYARNVGLLHAKGKWLLFADADDFYADGAWKCLDRFLNIEVDVVYFSVNCVDSTTLLPTSRNLENNDVIKSFLAGKRDGEILLRYTCWEPWNKMWSYTFVDSSKLQFEEIRRGNDAMFVLQGSDKAKHIMATEDQIYTVTYRSQSLSYTVSKESYFSNLLLKIRINKFYMQRHLGRLALPILYDIIKICKYFGVRAMGEAFLSVYKEHGISFIFCGRRYYWKSLKKRIKVNKSVICMW